MPMLPRYPVYVPSKGRSDVCLTAQFLIKDAVPFRLVVEPQEADLYAARFGADRLLVLPWCDDDAVRRAYCADRQIENGGLIAVRNWIKEHSIAEGHLRHWQLDDNIRQMRRLYRRKRIPCAAGPVLAATEDFVDRYENIALAGLNYTMFVGLMAAPPFHLNCRVYSCTLVLNSLPQRWRLRYNDDTDICLQVLAAGWCTTLLNIFMIEKVQTMLLHGGNTDQLYQGDGRLKMARSLERLWPGVVQTDRRFQRPQHVVYDAWRRFDTPLRPKPGVDLTALPAVNEYGMQVKAVRPVRSPMLQTFVTTPPGAIKGRDDDPHS